LASKYRIKYNDSTAGKSGKPESANMEIRVITLTPANVAAEITALGTLLTATQAMSLGLLASEQIVYSDTYSNAGFATDKAAQREQKWLVSMEDSVTHRVETFTVPCADTSLLPDNHAETLDLTASPMSGFKSAVEAVYRTINDHSAVMVSIKYVGRNS
jgi:hypothetical protein